VTTDSRAVRGSRRGTTGSDLLQEVADYAALQMDGGDGGWCQRAEAAHAGGREGGGDLFRMAAQRRAAGHLGAQGDLEMDATPPRQTASLPSSSRIWIFGAAILERPSTHLSSDPRGGRSVLDGGRTAMRACAGGKAQNVRSGPWMASESRQ